MKHLKLFENFENWTFIDTALDALTFIFDDYKHMVVEGVIIIDIGPLYRGGKNNKEECLDVKSRVEEDLKHLRNKYNFIVNDFSSSGQFRRGEIWIMEVKGEWLDIINKELDKMVISDKYVPYMVHQIDEKKAYEIDGNICIIIDNRWDTIQVYFNELISRLKIMEITNLKTYGIMALYYHLISKKLNLTLYTISFI